MRRVPALLVLLVLLSALPLPAEAATPTPMAFNGQPSGDVRGQVNAVGLDGAGRYAGVTMAPPSSSLVVSPALTSLFNVQGGTKAWDAVNRDLLTTGGSVLKVANGTAGQAGNWLVAVNTTGASNLNQLFAYQTTRGCSPCDAAWVYGGASGPITSADLTSAGDLVALTTATGAAANNSYILLRNNVSTNDHNTAPFVLDRVNSLSNADANLNSVSGFTAVAVGINASIPVNPGADRALVAVVGAQTTTASGVRGAIFVFQTAFDRLLLDPTNSLVQAILTDTPVTSVAITADGEYAVAGTQGGQVYLVSVGPALARRGTQGLDPGCYATPPGQGCQLRPWQDTVCNGCAVTSVDIAKFGGKVFAAGTSDGTIALFRNDLTPQGSQGAQSARIGLVNANTPLCSPQLHAPVDTVSFSNYGHELVAGVRDGVLEFDAEAYAEVAGASLQPSWCVAYDSSHASSAGVRADVSGDGLRVFAGTSHYVYGYTNFYHAALDTGGQDSMAALPGTRIQWPITVRNDGSVFDVLNLTVAGPVDPGWAYAISNASVMLFPGQQQIVMLNVSTPATLSPGNFTLTFSAQPQRNPDPAPVTLPLRLGLAQLRRVEIRPPVSLLVASAGTENTYPIGIHNGGNAADNFRVNAYIPDPQETNKSPGSEWAIRVDPSVVSVPANGDASVNLVVTPNPAQRGNSALIQIDVVPDVPSPGSEDVGDSRQVKVAVEPNYNGDISLLEAKDYKIWPGQSIFLNFTVKNLGNSQDLFTVKNFTDPANAPGWRLQLSDQTFRLNRPGDTHVVRVTATAQLGLQPGDGVRVVVALYSDGLQKQTPGSDGKVDEQSATVTVVPQPRPKFLGIPGPDPALLVAVSLALAVAAARRRGA